MTKKKNTIRISSWLNYEHLPQHIEHPTGESETVPGEAYTIPELYARANGGISVESLVHVKDANYTDTEDFDDVDPMSDPNFDLTDAQNIYEESNATITKASIALKTAAAKRKQKKNTTAQDEPISEEGLPEEPHGES